MPVAAGDYLPGAKLTSEKKSTSSAPAIGDVLTVQSNVWATAPTSAGLGPFRVCVGKTGPTPAPANADPSVSAVIEGIVYVTADGTINVGSLVTTNGATTAGRVVAYTPTSVATGTTPAAGDVVKARDEYRQSCGTYLGHENEGGFTSVPTAAAQGDIIRIHFRGNV